MSRLFLPAIAAVALLSGCEKKIETPSEAGVCYQVVQKKDGMIAFNPAFRNQKSLEECAASLDGVRVRFMRMGSQRRDFVGSYQGQFLFLDSGGLSVAQSLNGGRFNAFARLSDGRLAVPSYIKQPNGTGGQGPVTAAPAQSAPPVP
jgi:hypothetical protein